MISTVWQGRLDLRHLLRRCLPIGLIAGTLLHSSASRADVVSGGNVTPVPPTAGGTLSSTLLVGDTMLGTLAIGGGTTLTLTNSTALSVADKFNSIGAVSLTGLGSYLEAEGLMRIGNAGAGTFSVRSQATFQAKNGLQLGVSGTGNGTLIIEDLGSIISVQSSTIIGATGTGTMQLIGGGRAVAATMMVGRSVGSQGFVTIEGVNSQWQQNGSLVVGESGDGVIEVGQQGQLVSALSTLGVNSGGSGRLRVSGVGSRWNITGASAALNIGGAGYGEVKVDAGARTTVGGVSVLGTSNGGRGVIEVAGDGSQLSTMGLTIGNAGEGVLRVLDSGRLSAQGQVSIGLTATGRGEAWVDGEGSLFEIAGQTKMTVGSGPAGRGYLTVSGGGLVRAMPGLTVGASGELGLADGRVVIGEAALENLGLIWGAGKIEGIVTNAASGRIRADGGGSLTITKTVMNNGQIAVDQGEFEATTGLTNLGVITLRDGTLRTKSGGIVNDPAGQIAVIGGTVDVIGTVNNKVGAQIVVGGGATAVFHDVVTTPGQFFVFPGADVLMLKNLSFSSSTLLGMQLGATDLTDAMGQMEVGGQATLAGTLNVELAGGFTPSLGNSFSLLTAAGGVTGAFSAANLPALAGGLAWDLDYSPNSVLLSVVAGGGPSADFDLDGDIDAADLAKWKIGFGKSSGALPSDGDANGDGVVNGDDFMVWQRQLGTAPSAPVAGAVPEPTGVALAASALVMGIVGCRRRA